MFFVGSITKALILFISKIVPYRFISFSFLLILKMVIAIDGFSSCGKSTLAKQLALRLGISFVDTGAMYRSTTLYFLEKNIDINDANAVSKALDQISIKFKNIDGFNATFLNDKNVSVEIRSKAVNDYVSIIASIKSIRLKMVDQQKGFAKGKGVVMDGRDIGTVVFPNADFKFFITADPDIRAKRRYHEIIENGMIADLLEVKNNLMERDRIDSTRDASPLKIADDAILIDNSFLNKDEQLDVVLHYIN